MGLAHTISQGQTHKVTLLTLWPTFSLRLNWHGGNNCVLNLRFAWAIYFTFNSCWVVGLALWALARPPCAPRTANLGVLDWVVRETQDACFYMADFMEPLHGVEVLDTVQLRATCGPTVELQCVQVWGPMAEH